MASIEERINSLSADKRRLLEVRLQNRASAQSIPRRPNSEAAPMSFAQERFWFLQQLEPDSPIYNMPGALRISGDLNIGALKEAITTIFHRHESLRTTFHVEGENFYQTVSTDWSFYLPLTDLSSRPEAEREAELQQQMMAIIKTPFDLSKDLMLRGSIFYLAKNEYVLLFVRHHIASDFWSAGLFYRELAELYSASVRGEITVLPELPIQYADYALWQRTQVREDFMMRQLSYWQDQLAKPPIQELPTDYTRPLHQTYPGGRHVIKLSRELTEALKMISRQAKTTLFITTLAAFNVLLYRYSEQEDIIVGSPVTRRNLVETEQLIGAFLNTLAFRTKISGDLTFWELLSRVRQVAFDAYARQDLPFEKLLNELDVGRNMTRQPLFQVMIDFMNTPQYRPQLTDLDVSRLEVYNGTAPFDLSLYLREDKGELCGYLEYNSDLFRDETIGYMAAHFHNLLQDIVSEPDKSISQLQLLSAAERTLLLNTWNQTDCDFGQIPDIVTQFYARAGQQPAATAFIEGDRRLTFDTLNRRSNRLAHYLLSHGVSHGTRVGMALTRSLDMPVALLAIFKTGGVYVPLDTGYPSHRLRHIVHDGDVQMILTSSDWRELFAGLGNHDTPEPQMLLLDQVAGDLAAQPDENLHPQLDPNQAAYIIYTSGSTGRPKGIQVPHCQILNRLAWMWESYPFQPHEVGCQKTALSFVDSLWELLGYLLQGVPTIIVSDEIVRDPKKLVNTLAERKVTQLWLVPSLLRALLQTHPDLQDRLPLLRFWVSSGEALSRDLAVQFQEAMPHAVLYNLYGTSEVWDATWYDPELEESSIESNNVPIGRPISNVRTYILDQNHNPVPIGVPGELCISGIGLAKGYIKLPQATAERFIANPFMDPRRLPGEEQKLDPSALVAGHARLYRSGDMARWLPDGTIEYLGRIDQQVKIRGHRVEPGEIESLLRQRDEIKDAAAVLNGKGDEARLIAFVVAANDHELQPAVLKDTLSARLPEAMVPRQFRQLETFPLTPSGKIDRKVLAETRVDIDAGTDYVAPRTPLEEKLAEIWADVLHVPQVGVFDNFFDLGGHSLLGVTLFAQIEANYFIRLPLNLLFQAPTIAQLAEHLSRPQEIKDEQTLVAIQPYGTRPPFFFIHGLWGIVMDYVEISRNLGDEQPFYGLRASDLNLDTNSDDTIEALAARYIAELRRVQPTGPFHIGGFCFGGVVAYEIARQLRNDGDHVALLAIVEGFVKGYAKPPRYHPRRFLNILGGIPNWQSDYRQLGGDRIRQWTEMKVKSSWGKLQWRLGKANNYEQYRLSHQDAPGIPERFQELARHHGRMLGRFTPRPYEGRVTLFRTPWQFVDRAFFGSMDPDFGWGKLAKGGVEVRIIDGTHHTLLHKPYASSLAGQLADCLELVSSSS